MQIAIDAAGFTPAEADELRQAMGSKRSGERMAKLKDRLFSGMADRDITGATAEEIFGKLAAFSSFGFPESHAVSFAYLVYSSAWLKLHYPAAFCAALLNSQPMGFWSPQTLVADAKRHGVVVRGPHVNSSGACAILEWGDGGPVGGPIGAPTAQPAVRLGLETVRSVGTDTAERIAAGRPYDSVLEVVRRAQVGRQQLESLATAGALVGVGSGDSDRRSQLWAAGPIAQATLDRLPGLVVGDEAPPLPELSALDEADADLWATGLTVGPTAVELARPKLNALGVIPAAQLLDLPAENDPSGREVGPRVLVAGVVTHRQRPESAGGAVFLNLEDETGLVNVICSRGAWIRWRQVARSSPALLVRGRLERLDGSVSVTAETFAALDLGELALPPSRDFR